VPVFRHDLVVQSPNARGVIAAEVERLAGEGGFDRVRAFFAFATESGTQELIESLTKGWTGDWDRALKRWLISADFGFTEPQALRALSGLPNSQVRIPDAAYLLKHLLKPRATHHAKSLVLDRRRGKASSAPLGLMVGSANLTVSALSGNFEAVTVATWSDPLDQRDRARLATAEAQVKEFDRVWRKATKLDDAVLEKYQKVRKRVRKARRWPEQERQSMVRDAKRKNAGSFELAAALRSATKFWIQTGNMYKNLGEGGNQVDMTAGSRVFFGFSNRKVPPKKLLGEVDLAYWGHSPVARHVRYGNNSMDKIYLPNPGTEGSPATYANKTLLFERRKDGSFRFKVCAPGEAEAWKKESDRQGTAFKMRSGREFGVFR
jgi:HKD family nuclease